MAATLVTRFPEKVPELFAYQAIIVRAEHNYDPGCWVSYDLRREALARKDLNWSVTDPRLYNEAFTGRARSIPRCNFCLQDDHTGQYCPKNPNRMWLNWSSEWPPWLVASHAGNHPPPPTLRQGPMAELCRRFNDGRCRQSKCRYTHACSVAPHTRRLSALQPHTSHVTWPGPDLHYA